MEDAMRTIIVVTALSWLAFGSATLAQAPTPAPEYKRLAYFSGAWNFSGTVKDTPMGPGGPLTFKQTCELMEGGFALVCRSEGKGPMGPSKSAAIISYDVEKKAYTYTSAEINMPVFTALGEITGATWSWRSEATMGPQKVFTRVTVKEGGPKEYDFAMEISLDGKSFMQVVEGKATR
jgi:hypothetical protein